MNEIKLIKNGDSSYSCDVPISREDWSAILSDKKVTTDAAINTLLSFYFMPEQRSSCSDLEKIYSRKSGYYLGAINQFCRKVRKLIGTFTIADHDSNGEIYWPVAMVCGRVEKGLFVLVVQFLNCVERLASRSLRKGYVARHENLAKVKGRIDLMGNERYNMLTGHRERMLCKFDEFSADTAENRFIKHGLRIARNMIAMMEDHRAYPVIAAKCNRCLTAFSNVSDARTLRLPAIKHNKLFRDYSEALRLASMLMRRRDISVSEHRHADEDYVPVFRIDMSLLFEHYTLALLREKFGSGVFYQAKGKAGIADFLLNSPAETAVLDSKYTFKNNDNDKVDQQYIKQLSGYARDKRMLKRLGIDTSDEDKIPIVKCIILYPETREKDASFSYDLKAVGNIVKFFKCPVPLPVQNLQTTPTPT